MKVLIHAQPDQLQHIKSHCRDGVLFITVTATELREHHAAKELASEMTYG
jgi:hypothetical protein